MKGKLLVLILVLSTACNVSEREEQLTAREAAIQKQEQSLAEREVKLKLAELELAKKQTVDTAQVLDSLSDSAYVYANNLLGDWNTKMICTQTTCPGSAIGDSKTETWKFSFEQKQLLVQAMVKEKVIRIYTGEIVDGNVLELVEEVERSPGQPETKIAVRLKKQNDQLFDGQREILRQDCKIVYTVQLTR